MPARFFPALARTLSSIAAPIAVSSCEGLSGHAPIASGSSRLAMTACVSRSNRQSAMSKSPSATNSIAAGFAAAIATMTSCQRVRPLGPSATDMLSDTSASTITVPCCRALVLETNVGRSRQARIARNDPNRSTTSSIRPRPDTRDGSGPHAKSTAASAAVTTLTTIHDPTGSKLIAKSSIALAAIMRSPLPSQASAVAALPNRQAGIPTPQTRPQAPPLEPNRREGRKSGWPQSNRRPSPAPQA